MFALVFGGLVTQVEAQTFEVHPSFEWVNCVSAVQAGWSYDGSAFACPAAPSTVAPAKKYVPVHVARERLEAAGKWVALVNALSSDMPRLIKLLTLSLGLDPDDAEVRSVLTAIGADPNMILAL
jgi:hypothetical protein